MRAAAGVGNEPRGVLAQDAPERGLRARMARTAADLNEALGINAPQPGPQGAMPGAAPPMAAGAPPGAPQMPPGAPQGMPQAMSAQRPAVSPLQSMPSMHSPPMAAVLQGPQGAQGAQRPVGFARGGLAVFKGR